MATRILRKDGSEAILYNPAERGRMYADSLKSGKDHNGNALRDTQKAFRSGYLFARKESARIYRKKHPIEKSSVQIEHRKGRKTK